MKPKIKKKIKEIKKEIKQEIKEDFLNVPNIITLIRIILVFFVVYMIFSDYSRLSIAIVFGFTAFTDWLDGYFARKLKQTSSMGARLDQVTDRLFTGVILIALLIFFIRTDAGEILFLFIIASREIIGLPGFLIRIVRNKDPYTVKYIGKLTTFIQSVTIALLILGVSWIIYPVIITGLIGIVSGVDYLRDSLK
ncbi:MAG: CDP-alcohol phosphatidyltransferase family protein [Candidatus Nanoarchaeia archaeon]|nr:CDP-alcohol phosphatidyltransferase family protein [Candidatus Nanoarchaeia archaeon]MDD5740667.1 CDP-alcohol phosphatidyltransferase family protein [Candidatus Nanoarchaeia archaeon]